MLVISRIWKQFYVDPLPGSTQNSGNRMEKAPGLFMELNSWNKLALKAGGYRGLTAGTWWQAPGEPKAVVMPGNVACGTRLSSLWMASLFVRHRAGWLGKEQLRHYLPKPEFQVTLSMNYESPCPGVDCAGNVSGEEQMLLTRLGHSSSAAVWVCAVLPGYSLGIALVLCRSQNEACPSPHFTRYVHKKEIVKCCCQNLPSKHSFEGKAEGTPQFVLCLRLSNE